MSALPELTVTHREINPELAERIAREKAAHEDSHIDDILQNWWSRFPHVFQNPSMQALHAWYEEELGDIAGKVVLEYGCGSGKFATWVYGLGASVIGIDISDYNVANCRKRFEQDGRDPSRYRFEVMDAHALKLPGNSVDFVTGNGILHHLDLQTAFEEVDRVLKPGGKALFHEPLGGNPILKVYRAVSNYQTEDEQPLGPRELDNLRKRWNVKMMFSGLVTLPVAAVTSLIGPKSPNNWLLKAASSLEKPLNKLTFVQDWNRCVLLVYTKPE
jgi:SAM-dependent methyltransferase